MTVVDRLEIVGQSKAKSAVVQAVAKDNSLNLTGRVDFNKYGAKDNVGFESVTTKFVNSFILSTLVPDYNVKDGKNENLEMTLELPLYRISNSKGPIREEIF